MSGLHTEAAGLPRLRFARCAALPLPLPFQQRMEVLYSKIQHQKGASRSLQWGRIIKHKGHT